MRSWQRQRINRDLASEIASLKEQRQEDPDDMTDYAALLALEGALKALSPALNRQQRDQVRQLVSLTRREPGQRRRQP